jgi:hypothetical protein
VMALEAEGMDLRPGELSGDWWPAFQDNPE